jgi:hemolysin III
MMERRPGRHAMPWSGVLHRAASQHELIQARINTDLSSCYSFFSARLRLRFHNAIWHGFVPLAAGCHYSAVFACLPFA